jgi:hypothetical protein
MAISPLERRLASSQWLHPYFPAGIINQIMRCTSLLLLLRAVSSFRPEFDDRFNALCGAAAHSVPPRPGELYSIHLA